MHSIKKILKKSTLLINLYHKYRKYKIYVFSFVNEMKQFIEKGPLFCIKFIFVKSKLFFARKVLFLKKKVYIAKSKNKEVINNSSSGGIFYEIASYTIKNGGVVFGASFDEKWMVNMDYTESLDGLKKLMKSKYVKANINNSYKNAELFLQKGRLVVYCSTPCIIKGLKNYLKTNYENLICVELVCHGVMPQKIWIEYLNSIQKQKTKITDINFRDKEKSWKDYRFTVTYKDDSTFSEHFCDNKYMKLFLSDQYLTLSCYDCVAKKSFCADISIGDFWGSTLFKHLYKKNSHGLSIVNILTDKGLIFLKKIKNIKFISSVDRDIAQLKNSGWSTVNSTKRLEYTSNTLKDKKVGIVSLRLHTNIGGILQSFALQEKIKELGYTPYLLQLRHEKPMLTFAKERINIYPVKRISWKEYSISRLFFDAFVLGSDQIWRKDYCYNDLEYYTLNFASKWETKKIVYAASLGINSWKFNKKETSVFKNSLSTFSAISYREESAQKLLLEKANINGIVVCDPTLFYDREWYERLCDKIVKKNGYFPYILDNNLIVDSILQQIDNKFNINKIKIDKSVEEWLAAFRDAKFIVTDSYHGCIFSMIFNKPFLFINNASRGSARFDHLIKTYDLEDRKIYDPNKIDFSKLLASPNKEELIKSNRNSGIEFLLHNLISKD